MLIPTQYDNTTQDRLINHVNTAAVTAIGRAYDLVMMMMMLSALGREEKSTKRKQSGFLTLAFILGRPGKNSAFESVKQALPVRGWLEPRGLHARPKFKL